MKKTLLALAMFGVASAAVAQYTGPVANEVSTVQQLLKHGIDDQYVTLTGYLMTRLNHDKYTFDDGSAQIQVEIPTRVFPPGVAIDATTRVQITGEYDKEHFGTSEIEVNHLVAM